MAAVVSKNTLVPERQSRPLLLKWVVGLLVPLLVFTFIWGEPIVNQLILGFVGSGNIDYGTLIQATIFIALFYGAIIALAGYVIAADSGRRNVFGLWADIAAFALVPMILINLANDLFIGLSLCAFVWIVYLFLRRRFQHFLQVEPAQPVETLTSLDAVEHSDLMRRATMGGFWLATLFALIFLVVDISYFVTGQFNQAPVIFLIWIIARTILLPVIGYFLGRTGGYVAVRRTIGAKKAASNTTASGKIVGVTEHQLEVLSTTRAKEEARDLVPNDLPLQSSGARRFYLTLLFAFLIFYPVIDPYLFGYGTAGRLASYGDAGRYVILALGLNIVVGFAGLLDLGYVAFFAIGAYVWGMFGSQQWNVLTGMIVNPSVWPWIFWPMLIVTACIAALWGVVLGAPTLRLRGDYLAIVTLGFGEIVPVFFLNMDKYTNGTNGITGVYSPAFPGVNWSISTPAPYYYLILALIALVLFANVRLRDSRLGRAWIAIREDEIAASSSGVNLIRTKLFAFGAGAFFSGIAGAYYAAKLGTVSPENFSFSDSVIYLAMVVLGGLGSIPGVIVGALVVYAINVLVLSQLDTLATNPQSFIYPIHAQLVQWFPNFSFSNIRNLIFGIILVIIMIYRPEGLIPSARRRRELHHDEQAQEEPVEVGALDTPPGAPGFEAETRVE